jgi:hypothetical protein
MIARCGGEMKYFGIHRHAVRQAAEWAASEDPDGGGREPEDHRPLRRAGRCRAGSLHEGHRHGRGADQAVRDQLEADGVEGTPTLFINGTKYSNMAYDDLKPILDAELAK